MGLIKRKFEALFKEVSSWKQVVLYFIYAIAVTVILLYTLSLGIDKIADLFMEGL